MSILQELEHEGSCSIHGSVGFSSQVPWIFNGKITTREGGGPRQVKSGYIIPILWETAYMDKMLLQNKIYDNEVT